MKKKINIELSETAALCLQRMIADEIEKQKKRAEIFERELREGIIQEFENISNDLEKQGVHKYIKCN